METVGLRQADAAAGRMDVKVYFERVILPCVVDDVIVWHVEHGWVWDVIEVDGPVGLVGQVGQESAVRARRIGVFYCTLLCGDGAVVHFSTVPGMKIPWHVTLAAMRKGIRMVAPAVNVVYATIPAEKRKLIRCVEGLGFAAVDRYERMGTEENGGNGCKRMVLMKYLGEKGRYIKGKAE